jgi:hypothetical protein
MIRFRFGITFLTGLLFLEGATFALTNPSVDSTKILALLGENSKAIKSLEPKFETIYANQSEIIKGINFLRIRNRKKGRLPATSADLERRKKIEEIKKDPDLLKDLDKVIDSMVLKLTEGEPTILEKLNNAILVLLKKVSEDEADNSKSAG